MTLRRLFREFKDAVFYFIDRKRYDALLIALPIFLVTYGTIILIVGTRYVASRLILSFKR